MSAINIQIANIENAYMKGNNQTFRNCYKLKKYIYIFIKTFKNQRSKKTLRINFSITSIIVIESKNW